MLNSYSSPDFDRTTPPHFEGGMKLEENVEDSEDVEESQDAEECPTYFPQPALLLMIAVTLQPSFDVLRSVMASSDPQMI